MILQVNRRTLIVFGCVFAAVALALAAVFWWHQPGRRAGRVEVSPFENDMIETLVRGLLREDGIRNVPVCFISFGEGGTSPSSGFLARFADCRHPAVRSEDKSVSPPVDRFFEKDTGRSGIVIRIIKFNQLVSGVFDITVSFSHLPPGHDQFVYRLSHIAGDWVIKKRMPA